MFITSCICPLGKALIQNEHQQRQNTPNRSLVLIKEPSKDGDAFDGCANDRDISVQNTQMSL